MTVTQTLYGILRDAPREYPGHVGLMSVVLDSRLVYNKLKFEEGEYLCKTLYWLKNCMDFNQFCCTFRSIADTKQFCPFCPTELVRRGRVILAEESGWILLDNEFPRGDTRMWIIAPKRHIRDPQEFRGEDLFGREALFEWCRRTYGITSGGFLQRFGHPRWNAGTIEHLHVNVMMPDENLDVRPPLAKGIDGEYGQVKDWERLRRFFRKMKGRGGLDWLFSKEGVEETQPKMVAV